ncbi:MAG TPA: rRNA maturation RNase YbeY [Puia sp.]|nr:rRNA maturation RNase YbeY [Puia sp.]
MDKLTSEKIHFHFAFQPFILRNRTGLKVFIENIFIKEKSTLKELNFIFCNNREVKALNKRYLNHNYSTDILTFDFSKKGEAKISDIFISQEQVKQNAKEFKTSFKKEVHRVIFHGVLHLCGYKDKTSMEKETLRAKEDHYLTKYFSC